jgi:hypothetical protein
MKEFIGWIVAIFVIVIAAAVPAYFFETLDHQQEMEKLRLEKGCK